MKKTFILAVFATSFCLTSAAQTHDSLNKSPETVIIRVFESYLRNDLNQNQSKMVIIDADEHMEIRPLKAAYAFITENNKDADDNLKKLRTELQVWHNKGFQVKSTSSTTVIDMVITTLVLQKP